MIIILHNSYLRQLLKNIRSFNIIDIELKKNQLSYNNFLHALIEYIHKY